MDKIDEQIASLREGNTLTENEVKALCDKVGSQRACCGCFSIRLSVAAALSIYIYRYGGLCDPISCIVSNNPH